LNNYDRLVGLNKKIIQRHVEMGSSDMQRLVFLMNTLAPGSMRESSASMYWILDKELASLYVGLDLEEFNRFLRTQYPSLDAHGEETQWKMVLKK